MNVVWGVFILAVITSLTKYFSLGATVWLLEKFWLAGIIL